MILWADQGTIYTVASSGGGLYLVGLFMHPPPTISGGGGGDSPAGSPSLHGEGERPTCQLPPQGGLTLGGRRGAGSRVQE